jgi:peptidoglycan/LPS O-acetylase OafA/YrhL
MAPERWSHLHGIDALRAFAAASVVGLHLMLMGGWPALPDSGPLLWFHVGFLGVDVFFVISGYVIGGSALALMARDAAGWRASFVRRRLARILPLYLVTSVLFLLLVDASALRGPDAAWQVASHLLLLHNLLPSTAGSINGVAWTLATEAQLYVLTALLLPWLRRVPPWTVAVGGLLLAWAWRAGTLAVIAHAVPGADDNLRSHVATQWPGFADAYGLGLALALAQARGTDPRRDGVRWGYLLAGAAGLALGAMLFLRHLGSGDYWSTPGAPVFVRSVVALAALALLLGVRGWAASPRAPWVLLGVWSYGIYLWHLPVLQWLAPRLDAGPVVLALGVVVLTLALSAAGWRWIEKPAIDWARRRGG